MSSLTLPVLLIITLSFLLILIDANPWQKSVVILQQQSSGDDFTTSVDTLSNDVLSNLLKKAALQSNLRNKEVPKLCYREDKPTVDVTLYYEALCPGCMQFVETELYPTYQKLGKYINVGLVPYGNSRTILDSQGKHVFVCQHGKEECLNNVYQACLLNKITDQKLQLELVNCLMGSIDAKKKTGECMAKFKVGPKPSLYDVEQCANGSEGNELMYKLGVATNSLKPSHEYTPWLTVDGVHSEVAEDNLEKFLCSGPLKGAPECSDQEITTMMPRPPAIKKCYREDEPSTMVSIDVYYEALCGGCVEFITQQLQPTYPHLKKYLNVQLFPYGNTRMSEHLDIYGMHIFSCQHGIEECVNNLFQACLYDSIKDQMLQIQLASCLMGSRDPHMKTEECMKNLNVTSVKFEDIDNCANYEKGNKLMYKLAMATSSLVPPHKYAPWVVIDGKQSLKGTENLESFLCNGPLKNVQECQSTNSVPTIIQLF